jgi:flagellar protein FliJ
MRDCLIGASSERPEGAGHRVGQASNGLKIARRRPTNQAMNGPSYRFRLERVRALRERHEDEAKAQLGAAMMRRQQCEERVTEAADRIQDARELQLQTGTTAGTDFLARQAYLERVETAHRSTLDDLRRHEEDVAGRRTALQRAAQDRQALERLKAKGLAEHQKEAARQEGVMLDEIAINGFRRRAA